MPLYTFECDQCRDIVQLQRTFEEHDHIKAGFIHNVATKDGIEVCGGICRQVYDFHFNLGMREHYSDQLDMHVTSDRHFNNELKRQQAEYTERMGFDVKFETVDPSDMAAAGATDAGLEDTARAHHDAASDGHRSIFT